MKTWNDILNVLTDDEKQLLADTINYGGWGSCDMEFINDDGEEVAADCCGYITNLAKDGGHFSGRIVSSMFRSIYRKIENKKPDGWCKGTGAGEITCHYNNWWEDGSGDVLFIRAPFYKEAEEWAKNYNKESNQTQTEEVKSNETMFEKILKSMSEDDKHEVFANLHAVEKLFKEYVEKDGGKWIDIMCDDEALRNIFIGSSLASQLWFNEHKARIEKTGIN